MPTTIEKVLYTARVHNTGGREGKARSDDGALEVTLVRPGKSGGTNPEQMFAAGYAACFIGAIQYHAGQMKVALPADMAVDTEADLGPASGAPGFALAVRMKVSLPGLDRATAQAILDAADSTCPYSNATRGNIDVTLTVA